MAFLTGSLLNTVTGKTIFGEAAGGNIFPKHSRVAKALDQSMCAQSCESRLSEALLTDAPDCVCLSLRDESWAAESSKRSQTSFEQLMDMIIARSPKFGMLLEELGSWDTTITLLPLLKIGLNDLKGFFFQFQ